MDTAQHYNQQGESFLKQGDLQSAEAEFVKAIQTDAEYAPTYGNMLRLTIAQQNYLKALEWGALALQAEPEKDGHKEQLIEVLKTLNITTYNDTLCWITQECLTANNVDFFGLHNTWLSLIKKNPQFAKIYKLAGAKDYKKFAKGFEKLSSHKILSDIYVLRGLQKLLVPDYEFEIFLTHLRRWLLENGFAKIKDMPSQDYENMLAALALYCFHTEYIFFEDDSEKQTIEKLRAQIEADTNGSKREDVLRYACYRPFHTLSNAKELTDTLFTKDRFEYFVDIQYRDHVAEQAIKAQTKSLTPIEDETSQNVREQYEQFPYPRWQSVSASASPEEHVIFLGEDRAAYLATDKINILIAGCGTGQQACEYAMAFKNAKLTAVDLSLTNLAYAQNKAMDYDIDNIEFFHGDILQLPQNLGPFDLIICTGVLHHMQDPEEGWKVIAKLLKPEGFMRIALYSDISRGFINRGRAVIANKDIPPTADGMRYFRKNAKSLLGKKDWLRALNTADYYSMSECRDAFFHIHEDNFDIPRIQQDIEDLGLEFCGFEQARLHKDAFAKLFPDNPDMMDLGNWHAFEQKHPETFLEMYRFFVRKPA